MKMRINESLNIRPITCYNCEKHKFVNISTYPDEFTKIKIL